MEKHYLTPYYTLVVQFTILVFFVFADDDTSHKDTGAGLEHGHGAEISDDSPIDSLISEWEKTEGVQPAQSSTTAPSKPIAQKESVFVRLANRIKVSLAPSSLLEVRLSTRLLSQFRG